MSSRAHSDVLRTADIYVRDQPIGLRTKASHIYDDFAIHSDTAISIAPDVTRLIQGNQEFRRKATEVLGPLNLIEIKVTGRDRTVLVRDPSVEDSEFQPIALSPSREVQKIAQKTQQAYQAFLDQSSRSASFDSSPRSAFYDRSFDSVPYSPVDSSHLHDRLQLLERENRELRAGVENLQLREELRATRQLLEKATQDLSASGEMNQELTSAIDNLEQQLSETEELHRGDLGRLNQALANSVALNIALLVGVAALQEENTQLKREVAQLQERHRNLGHKSAIQEAIISRAQELVGAASPAELTGKIKELQATLQEKHDENRDLIEVQHGLQQQLDEANEELRRLRPENKSLQSDLDERGEELDQIASLLGSPVTGKPVLPIVQRHHERTLELERQLGVALPENRRLLKQVEAYKEAEQAVLREFNELLQPAESFTDIRQLPAAVGKALSDAQQNLEQSSAHVSRLESSLLRLEQKAKVQGQKHREAIQALRKEVEEKRLAALQAESELAGEKGHVLDLKDQAEGLRRELSQSQKELREAQQTHAQEKHGLGEEIKELRRDLQREKEISGELRSQVQKLLRAADETAERHQVQLREMEHRHESEMALKGKAIDSLTSQLEEARLQNTQAVAVLEEKLSRATEAQKAAALQHAEQKGKLERQIVSLGSQLQLKTEEYRDASKALAEKEEELRRVQETLGQRADLSVEEAQQLKALLRDIESITERNRGLLPRESVSLADELRGLDEVQEELPASQQYRDLPQTVGKIIEALKAARRELQQNSHLVRRNEAELIDLRDQVEREQQSTKASDFKVSTLQRKIEELEGELAHDQSRTAKVAERQKVLIGKLRETLRTERERFVKELQEARAETKEARAESEQHERRARQLTSQLELERAKVEQANEANTDLTRENERIRKRLTQLRAQVKHNAAQLKEMETDRDYWQGSSEGFQAAYEKLQRENIALESQVARLTEAAFQNEARMNELYNENRRLREVLATVFDAETWYTPEDYQRASERFAQKHKRELSVRDDDIERLGERVQTVEALRDKQRAAKLEAREERNVALRKLDEEQRRNRSLTHQVSTTQERNERLLDDLRGAHDLTERLQHQVDGSLRDVQRVREERQEAEERMARDLEEALLKAEQEKAVALHELELLHGSLDRNAQDIQTAERAGEVLGNLVDALDGMDELQFPLTSEEESILHENQKRVDAQLEGRLPRHKQDQLSSQISILNNYKTTALNQLDLFTQFVGVTNSVKEIEKLPAYIRLAAINKTIRTLKVDDPQRAVLLRMKRNLLPIVIPALLNQIHVAISKPGQGRFKNFGEWILFWDLALNGLSEDKYKSGNRNLGFKGEYKNLEQFRKTVGVLNRSFNQLIGSLPRT